VTVIELSPDLELTCADAGLLGGRFRLDRWAGEISGVSLWQATDELLRRSVAVHLLPDHVPAGLPEAVQAAARVNDVRLCAVFDVCYDPGRSYLISEWAGEASLEQLLQGGLPGPALAATIMTGAAQALAAAHAGGRPHLCLTPRSVHWGRSGVKITGLGIDAALSGTTGTAGSDTAALARIMYAMLTGYWPGDPAESGLPAAPRTSTGLYEPAQIRPEVPALLSAITCHAMHDQPGQGATSIRTPAELAAALRPPQHVARVPAQHVARVPAPQAACVAPPQAACVAAPQAACVAAPQAACVPAEQYLAMPSEAPGCVPSQPAGKPAPRHARFTRRVNFASCAG
jgi:eukaryotic-like serine/threonine-protein kinase